MKSTRTIEVTVSPRGDILIDAVGFKGADCEKATRFLEEALGGGVVALAEFLEAALEVLGVGALFASRREQGGEETVREGPFGTVGVHAKPHICQTGDGVQ